MTARRQSPSPSSSSSSSGETPTRGVDLSADDTWQDVTPDTEDLSFVSLFSVDSFPDLEAMLEHDKASWGFDLKSEVSRLGLDFYGCVRLVNYIRREVGNGVQKPDVSSEDMFSGDEYLKPVLEDDAVLFCLDDLVESVSSAAVGGENSFENDGQGSSRIAELEGQLESLQRQFAEYRSAVEKTLDERWNSREAVTPKPSRIVSEQDMDKQYFDSYSYYDIHETMLKDEVRTSAYRDFIYDNKHLFADRIVLDIGCGTGILSLFAAKAGARHVYAVDNSEIITKAREIVAENGLQDKITCIRGRIEDITLPLVLPGPLNSGDASPSGPPRVDIIVSEWFGYCLLFENMLDSVLHARDTYLAHPAELPIASSTSTSKPPLMVPSHTTMHIAPLSDPDYIAEHITFWSSVYGFSMAPILRPTKTNTSTSPTTPNPDTNTHQSKPFKDIILRPVQPACIPAPSARFNTLDLYTVRRSDLEFAPQPFSVTLTRDLPDGLDGWVLWFDVFFLPGRDATLSGAARGETWPGKGREDWGVAFTTGTEGRETHWMQGCLMIERDWAALMAMSGTQDEDQTDTQTETDTPIKGPTPLKRGQLIRGAVGYKRSSANSRELEIEVSWEAVGTAEKGVQVWFLQ